MKSILVVFKSGTTVRVPYTFNFYKELKENIGKDSTVVHRKATIKTKDVQAIVFEGVPTETETEVVED